MQATPLAVLLALTALSVAAMPLVSAAQCIPCEPVNNVCRKVLHVDCLASDETPASSASAPAAQPLASHALPGLAEADGSPTVRCAGLPCDVINLVCEVARGGPCVR